ncbi:MAG: glycosyltransferase family 4 protein [Planctomycetota bacterium]
MVAHAARVRVGVSEVPSHRRYHVNTKPVVDLRGPETAPLRLAAFYPNYNSDAWGSHICLSLCDRMHHESLPVRLVVPASDPAARRPCTRDSVPELLRRTVYRLDKSESLSRLFARRVFRAALAEADAAYLWAGVPMPFFDLVERASLPLVLERINTHRRTAGAILAEARRRAGLPPPASDPQRAARELAVEDRKLARARFVFAPSPHVADSLRAAGVPEAKILRSSYGWSPQRIRPLPQPRERGQGFTAVFVGSVCVRKGAHLLLDAWVAADIPGGQLVLAGRVDDDIATLCRDHLQRADVRVLGHVSDVNTALAQADAFVFPTLEEGSPLVVYEAMAHGLAILTTPMGGGEIVRDDREGLVRQPYDRDAWVDGLRRLARDVDLGTRLGAAARARADDYTWEKVGSRRRAQLLAAFGI